MSEVIEVKKGYKDSLLGLIPVDWDFVELGDVSEVKMGQSPPSSSYNQERIGIPLIQGNADIKKRLTVPRIWTSEPTKLCQKNEIILTVRAPVGAVAISTTIGCIGRGVCTIKPIEESNSRYVYQYLISLESKWTNLEQGSTFTAVNGSDIRSLKIPLPPLPEQKKIAEILTTVDDKIEAIEARIKQTQALKKGLMQRLLTKGIGHDKFKDSPLGEIPESWEVKHINQTLKIASGKDYKHLKEGKIPVYGTGGFMTFVNDFLYDGDSVGIGRKGTIDKPVYLTGKFWTVDTLFYTKDFKCTIPKFLYYVFLTVNWKRHNEASGVPSLSKATIEKIKIPVPPLSEQSKIVEILTSVDNKIEVLEEKKSNYQTLKKGLMQQLLTGKMRVNI